MDKNERDTHFQGFAKLLQQELYDLLDQHTHELDIDIALDHAEWVKRNQLLIAQRAYDLAYHVLYETGSGMERVFGIPYKLEQVSDLTEWPNPPQLSPEPTSD